jgi:hypothetical protein
MNASIKPGLIPPMPGLDKEEPEFANEEDIPRDEPHPESADESGGIQQRPRERE